MSNPPAGWYPDPTGQPNTIRWWNGTKWTNKTEQADEHVEDSGSPEDTASTMDQPVRSVTGASTDGDAGRADSWGGGGAGGADTVGGGSGSGAADVAAAPASSSAEAEGWWGTEPTGDGASRGGGPADGEDAGGGTAGAEDAGDGGGAGKSRLSAAERARATWTGPRSGDVPSWHWTQREPDADQQVEREPAVNAEPVDDSSGSSWTLRVAEAPPEPDDSSSAADETRDEAGGQQDGSVSTGQIASADAEEGSDPAAAWWAAGQAQAEEAAREQEGDSWSAVSFTQQPATFPQPADEPTAPAATQQASPGQQAGPSDQVDAGAQPGTGQQADEDSETGELPVVDIEAAQATWQSTGPTQWELAAAAQQAAPADTWQASTQPTTGTDNWQNTGQQSTEQEATGWQGGPQSDQQAVGWQTGQPSALQAGGWQSGQQAVGWQGPAAAGQWQGVGGGAPSGKGRKGKTKKASGGSSSGGGALSGVKGPLLIGGPIALVLLILAAVVILTKEDDPKGPGGNATPTTSQPSTQPTGTKQGQSKDPKLHEGERISSEAISFPRRPAPWSDRKRLVPQLQNSSGQYLVLQQKFDGKNDWYASIFVGALGTGSGFDGNPQQTAGSLAVQVRQSLYGGLPATFRGIANGAIKRSGKNGWFYQQSVTVANPRLTAKVLTLTVAVFDLGDGSAVAYISDIPSTRPDLKAAESQAYKGINVG